MAGIWNYGKGNHRGLLYSCLLFSLLVLELCYLIFFLDGMYQVYYNFLKGINWRHRYLNFKYLVRENIINYIRTENHVLKEIRKVYGIINIISFMYITWGILESLFRKLHFRCVWNWSDGPSWVFRDFQGRLSANIFSNKYVSKGLQLGLWLEITSNVYQWMFWSVRVVFKRVPIVLYL